MLTHTITKPCIENVPFTMRFVFTYVYEYHPQLTGVCKPAVVRFYQNEMRQCCVDVNGRDAKIIGMSVHSCPRLDIKTKELYFFVLRVETAGKRQTIVMTNPAFGFNEYMSIAGFVQNGRPHYSCIWAHTHTIGAGAAPYQAQRPAMM